jgi:hypothetical protein
VVNAASIAIFTGKCREIGVLYNKLDIDLRPLGVGILSLVHDRVLLAQTFAPFREERCAEIEQVGIAKDLCDDMCSNLRNSCAHDRFFDHCDLFLVKITSNKLFREP